MSFDHMTFVIQFFCPSPALEYCRKPKPPCENSNRNVAFWLGNQIRLYARKRFKTAFVVSRILSAGLDAELANYFGCKLYGESEFLHEVLTEFVDKKLRHHILNGVAA